MHAVAVAVLAVALAACGSANDCSTSNTQGSCSGGDVCARDGECLSASLLRVVHVTWTVNGQPASEATCAPSPSLYVMFFGFDQGDSFGFEPVPCQSGLFTIDKLPTRFTSVELGNEARYRQEKVIDAQGNVAFDVVP